ncbi:hypothetical protein BDN70DRAFT_684895 [Pholiota conissans]|uniref:F-box domain-containing protein n=1 Tax=Pholiota conissans TaxID=109636 RepID=A0A9P6D1D0_9AGAR|nr:hypothetical protein BDN70DRAFT_684895 [Pholiota conissans]
MVDETANSSLLEQPYIDNLPDELLGSIFLFNALKYRDGDGEAHNSQTTTLRTILVCKRWNTVVMNYPVIWSHLIDYEKQAPVWIKELLQRSKMSPLDVGEGSVFRCIQLRNPRAQPVLGYIFEQAPRIRTLSLQIRLSPWDYICKFFLQHPAPTLEYLSLITACPFPDCLFPGPLLAENAPNLRKLHLQRCLVDFSSTTLFNLTELSVMDILTQGILSMRRPDNPLKIAPTVAKWIEIISHIPGLKYLTLSNAMTPFEDNDSLIPIVDLPNLLFLTVGARFQDGVTFLNHLTILETCGVRLRLNFSRSSSDFDATRLLPFLGNRLSHWPQDVTDRYLQAKILSGDRIHFGNSRRVGHIWDMTEEAVIEEHSQISEDPLVWLVLTLDNSEDTVRFFNQLLSLYESTYSTTKTLDLWLDEEFANTLTSANATPHLRPALNVLRSFTAVKTLNLLERSPLYLLPLLQSLSPPDQPLLPSLRSLRLTRTDFEDQQRAAYFTVIAFLIWRAQIHNSLIDLQIIESKISKETEDSLARIGGVKVILGTPQPRPVVGSIDVASTLRTVVNI